jgi:hypothetical protein
MGAVFRLTRCEFDVEAVQAGSKLVAWGISYHRLR